MKEKAEAATPRPSCCCLGVARALDRADVLRLHALLALGRLIGDLLALFKGPEAVSYYSAVVHEEVFATLIGGDKAVALVLVEPLDRSFWGHVSSPPFLFLGPTNKKSRPETAGGASLTVTHLRLLLDYTTSGPEPRPGPSRPYARL